MKWFSCHGTLQCPKKLAISAVHYLRRYFSEHMPSLLDTVRKKVVQFLEPEHCIKSFNTGTEQCWGSVTFWYGTDPDPYLWPTDPGGPKTYGFLRFRTFNTGTFTTFSKDKKFKKNVQNSRNRGFSCYFCLMMEESGSVLLTNGSGCGSWRPKKHTDPTDPDPDPQHWYLEIKWCKTPFE